MSHSNIAESIFVGDSEMAGLMRSHDWAQTPLGPVETWPQSLRSTLSICLNSRFPTAIYWGPDHVLLYNDAWRPIVGNKHPWSLGRAGREVWSEIWNDIGPALAGVLANGQSTFHTDELLSMHRSGYIEECFFEHTFSPIQGEGGVIKGVFNVASETTYRVLNERREAIQREQTLRQDAQAAHQKLETVLSSISDGVYTLDRDWCFTYVNDRVCEMASMSREELLGHCVWDLFPETVETDAYTHMHRALREQIVVQFEYLHSSQDRWFEHRVYPSADGITVFLADISARKHIEIERKRAETALRQREEQFRQLADAMPQIVWIADATGQPQYVNQRWVEYTGLTLEQTANQHWVDQVIHPDDLAATYQVWRDCLETGNLYQTEFRLKQASARPGETGYRWFLCRAVPICNQHGQITHWYGTLTDLHDRRQAEAKIRRLNRQLKNRVNELQTLLDLLPVGVAIADDPECHIIRANPYLSELIRVPPDANASQTASSVQRPLYRLYHNGEEIPLERLPMQYAAIHNTEIKDDVIDLVHPDGTVVKLLAYCSPLLNERGDVRGVVGVFVDITQRVQNEAALRQSETILNAFISSSPLGMAFLNRDWRYVYANEALAATNGIPLDEHYGRTLREVLPQWAPFVEPIFQQIVDTKTPLLNQEIMGATNPPDQMRYGLINYFPVCLPDGEVMGVGISSLDITARKTVEMALQESEEKYRTLFESIDEGFCIIEVISDHYEKPIDYRLLVVNPAFEKQTGHSHVIGKTIREIAPQNEDYWFEHYGHVALTGEPLRIEAYAAAFNGWYEVHAFRVGEPELRQVGILFNNITERKQAEEELRQKNAILNVINESTPTPIFVKDRQGRIIYANPATLAVLGKSEVEVIGSRDIDLYPNPEDALKVMENDQRIMTSGQMEVVEESPDGIRTFLGIKVPYRNESGEVIGLIGISNDISERVQIDRDRERVLQQEQAAREAAEAANRIKDEFLAVVSHELRSPLNPILGWAKLLRTRQLDKQKTERALEVIERNAQMQAQLINDLLDVSRILRGQLSLDTRSVDLANIIHAALETVRLAAEVKSIEVYTHLSPDVGPVAGDAGRLQQVVWNLLSNAVKFTAEGGRVEVRLEQVGNKGVEECRGGEVDENSSTPSPLHAYAQITVTDTGKGIPPDFLPYVFDHFRQESSATTRRFGGLGLGLAIVRHLVELHGGTVHADSLGEGQGATFTVRLPLMAHPLPTCQETSPCDASLDLPGVRILVVDDDDNTREFLTFLLELHGANVVTAASANEALKTLAQFRPDVLLSDIGMPDVDGYMLLKQVRALHSKQGETIPAIALTAYASEIDYQQAMAAGFQRHITKPIEPSTLICTIAALIERRIDD